MFKKKDENGSNRNTEEDHQDSNSGEGSGLSTVGGTSAPASSGPIGTSSGLEIFTQQDAIRAWKNVLLYSDKSHIWIASWFNQSKVSLESDAVCYKYYGMLERHNNSDPLPVKCICGHYGLKDLGGVAATSPIAEVDFSGTVIEAENGYRASHQRILSILIMREYCEGGFLCDNTPELLAFNKYRDNQSPQPVCREHATKRSVELAQVGARLGVEVKWLQYENLK